MFSSTDEKARLEALYRYAILDTEPEQSFETITSLALQLLNLPVAGIGLLDRERIWLKSKRGFEKTQLERWAGLEGKTADPAGEVFFSITDTNLDPRTAGNQVIFQELSWRFYAGVRLTSPEGYQLGMLFVADHQPRELAEAEKKGLVELAGLVVELLEARYTASRLAELKNAQTFPYASARLDPEEFRLALARQVVESRRLNRLYEAEKQLRQAQDQLRQSQKMEAIGQLAGGVAHDFNNLLTAIMGYSDLILAQVEEDNPLREEIIEIQKAANRAAGLTHQLLAFSRKQILQPKLLNLNTVVADMDKLLRRVIGEDVELIVMVEPQLGLVKADRSQLEQVILNLAVNARDAMPHGGKLIIETANLELSESLTDWQVKPPPGHYVQLMVSDTGIGMDLATQLRIFEPFFTTKELGLGTGLGLSTVYGIIKQSGGYIWVYSQLQQGTTFKVYLPVVQPEENPEIQLPKATESAKPLPASSKTIMLVEDEESVRNLSRLILEKEGYNVIEAKHGKEALILCEQHSGKIDLLLTDVVMPYLGGPELAEQISLLRPGIKVVYLSGYTDKTVVQTGLLMEGVAFLEKPFTPQTLVRRLRQVLE